MLAPIIAEGGLIKLVDTSSQEFAEAKAKISQKVIKANKGNMKEDAIDKRGNKSEDLDFE